jgi:hypothetical protein
MTHSHLVLRLFTNFFRVDEDVDDDVDDDDDFGDDDDDEDDEDEGDDEEPETWQVSPRFRSRRDSGKGRLPLDFGN